MTTPGGTQEVDFKSTSGYLALVIALFALLGFIFFIISRVPQIAIPSFLLFLFMVKGIYILQPNQSALMMLFGAYRGTDYSTGLRWANPFMNKKKISLRLRNFNSE
jgi:regulator of protease activity HflC (stomatin/prohibitin superfamily)